MIANRKEAKQTPNLDRSGAFQCVPATQVLRSNSSHPSAQNGRIDDVVQEAVTDTLLPPQTELALLHVVVLRSRSKENAAGFLELGFFDVLVGALQ